MNWVLLLLVVAALLAAVRIYVGIRRGAGAAHDDWDERLVQNLRAAGVVMVLQSGFMVPGSPII